MLSAFNQLLASILALAFLCMVLVGPFVALWIVLSMRRDLRRIADCMTVREALYRNDSASLEPDQIHAARMQDRKVSLSAFGR